MLYTTYIQYSTEDSSTCIRTLLVSPSLEHGFNLIDEYDGGGQLAGDLEQRGHQFVRLAHILVQQAAGLHRDEGRPGLCHVTAARNIHMQYNNHLG